MSETTAEQATETAPAPTPADMPSHSPQATETAPETDWKGKVERLNADVAKERDLRQAIADELKAYRAGFGEGLADLTPAQIIDKLTGDATAKADAAERELVVLKSIPANVDAEALRDSRAFQDAVAGAQDVAAAVTQFVADHPRFLRTNPAAGGRDLNEAPAPTGELDPIAAEILSKIGR